MGLSSLDWFWMYINKTKICELLRRAPYLATYVCAQLGMHMIKMRSIIKKRYEQRTNDWLPDLIYQSKQGSTPAMPLEIKLLLLLSLIKGYFKQSGLWAVWVAPFVWSTTNLDSHCSVLSLSFQESFLVLLKSLWYSIWIRDWEPGNV